MRLVYNAPRSQNLDCVASCQRDEQSALMTPKGVRLGREIVGPLAFMSTLAVFRVDDQSIMYWPLSFMSTFRSAKSVGAIPSMWICCMTCIISVLCNVIIIGEIR